MDHNSLVFLITGCSSGFGYEIAKTARQRGFRVIATARRIETLQPLKELGAETLQLDVTASATDLRAFSKQVWTMYGHVDVLINNAGYVLGGAFEECSPEEVQTQFSTNVFGVLNLTNAFLPYFRERRSGMVVNISSPGGSLGVSGLGAYCASKAALDSISDTWARELAEFNVKCVSIQPGLFRTRVAGDNLKLGSNSISEYTIATRNLAHFHNQTGTERGDPAIGASRIVDFIAQNYDKAPSELPLRLALGPDAFEAMKMVLEGRLAELEKWREWSFGTDFAGHCIIVPAPWN
ncbi:Short-chain dehydrogenase/reductase family protein [Mycena chlorophos]|uniref:Short-chain dehydrogenase/reductase family protein n=1 Tax=Mycena chlorophos TaxID=658473 RepID=A0A8H6VS63_MYCCL|nr:Short-chain dehydrogenase/reductase family protein [Mycena chlorophos]